jgi:hypothetical protein
MAISIPHSFTDATIAEASEVNANFDAVETFVNGLQDGTLLDSNIITTSKLADNSITNVKIAPDAVTTVKILDNSITQAKLADRTVGSAELDNLSLNAQVGTTYTLALSDAHKVVTLNNASPITLTVPPNSSVAFEVGDQVNLLQLGAGQATIAAGAGVTIRSEGSKLKLKGQYAVATLLKIDTDTWVAIGNLSA